MNECIPRILSINNNKLIILCYIFNVFKKYYKLYNIICKNHKSNTLCKNTISSELKENNNKMEKIVVNYNNKHPDIKKPCTILFDDI